MSEDIRPHVKAIAIDVTEYCFGYPDIIKRILDVYVYDDNVNLHICSFEKSIELWKAYSTCEFVEGEHSDPAIEAADEWVLTASSHDQDVIYMSRASVERMVDENPEYANTYGTCTDPCHLDNEYAEMSREMIEEAIEDYRGNPPW